MSLPLRTAWAYRHEDSVRNYLGHRVQILKETATGFRVRQLTGVWHGQVKLMTHRAYMFLHDDPKAAEGYVLHYDQHAARQPLADDDGRKGATP